MAAIDTVKKRKVAHILSEILKNGEVCKLALRTATGYSTTTVDSALKNLSEQRIITIGEKKSGAGSRKIAISANPRIVIAGVSYYRMKLYGKLMQLDGKIVATGEKELNESHCDLSDSVTALIESMLSASPTLAAIGVSVAMGDSTSFARILALRFSVPVHVSDSLSALAMYYRYKVKKNNTNLAVLYAGKRIRSVKVKEWGEDIELGNLLSPIISAKKGRLIYDEVLSAEAVRHRMRQKFGKAETAFEAGTLEPEISFYAKQLQYALGELILLIDKTVKPSAIITAGEYMTKELIEGSLDSLAGGVRAEVVCFEKGRDEIIEGACYIAYNGLCYY